MTSRAPVRARRPAAGIALIAALQVTLWVALPVLDARAHGHGDPHAAAPHLHAPDDRSCPPPHAHECHFCRVGSAAAEPTLVDVAGFRGDGPPLSQPATATLHATRTATPPIGARAPPSA